MSDSWLQRLVVRGPSAQVWAFQRAVASAKKAKAVAVKSSRGTQLLSFWKLSGLLPREQACRFETKLEEPWDLVVDPARELKDGSREVTYKFQLSAFGPEELIVQVSRLYPELCFVSGCVAPSNDEQSSILVHNGRRWQWCLPLARKTAIWKKLVPEETEDNSDEVTWGLVEADWHMMDELVAHWQPKMNELMALVLKGDRAVRFRKRRLARRQRLPN